MSSKNRIIQAALFYVGWFGCIFLGPAGYSWITLAFPILSYTTLWRLGIRKELALCVFISLIGILFDGFSSYFSLIRFEPPPSTGVLPLWMISLWLLFGASLILMQHLFKERYLAAIFLGAIFGPVSYLSGEKFKVLYFNKPFSIFVYVAFWSIYFASSLYVLNRASRASVSPK